jgi:hypothetical protein
VAVVAPGEAAGVAGPVDGVVVRGGRAVPVDGGPGGVGATAIAESGRATTVGADGAGGGGGTDAVG